MDSIPRTSTGRGRTHAWPGERHIAQELRGLGYTQSRPRVEDAVDGQGRLLWLPVGNKTSMSSGRAFRVRSSRADQCGDRQPVLVVIGETGSGKTT